MKQTDLHHQQQQLDPSRTRVEQCGNQILRVRGDSDSDMEALFSVLQNRNSSSSVGSFRNRKLPASFFRPPDPRPLCPDCSSGSGDGAAALCQGLIDPGTVPTSTTRAPPVISHCRSRSSPVRLLRSQHNSPPLHVRQSSMDGCTDEFHSPHPAAWDMAAKCPKYQMK